MTSPRQVTVYIDREPYTLDAKRYTGAQIRALVEPPAADLWLDVDDAQDRAVPTEAAIQITNGMHFFTSALITIYLDGTPHTVPQGTVTENQLRTLTTPPIGDDFDVFLDIPDAMDRRLSHEEIVRVRGGERFFIKRRHHRPEVTIIINATPHVVRAGSISFDDLVELAYPQPPGPDPEYQVSYYNGDPRRPEGFLLEGQAIETREGMVFNVTGTDKS